MNAAAKVLTAYATLYGPSAASQLKALPDIADALHAQLCNLSSNGTAEDAETVAANIAGAHRAVLRLREALLREQGVPDGIDL